MKLLKQKFRVKDVIDDLNPEDKEKWVEAFEHFFEEVKNELKNPTTAEVKLFRFLVFKPKFITSFQSTIKNASLYHKGEFPEEELEQQVRKLITIYERSKPRVRGIFEEMVPELDRWIGEAPWWKDLRNAFGVIPNEFEADSSGSPDDAFGQCRSADRE